MAHVTYDDTTARYLGWYGREHTQMFGSWVPTKASPLSNPKPCYIHLHGGGVISRFGSTEQGGGFLGGSISGGDSVTDDVGAVLISAEYSHGAQASDEQNLGPVSYVPKCILQAAEVVSFVKTNWNNEDIVGVGNTIDVNRIIIGGYSQGAMWGPIIALLPPHIVSSSGRVACDGLWGPEVDAQVLPVAHNKMRFQYAEDIGVQGFVNHDGAMAYTNVTTAMSGHQASFGRMGQIGTWDTDVLLKRQKQFASAWYHLCANRPGKNSMGAFNWYTLTATGDSTLKPEHYDPTVVQNTGLPGGCWTNPHNDWQCEPLCQLMAALGYDVQAANAGICEFWWGKDSDGDDAYRDAVGNFIDDASQEVFGEDFDTQLIAWLQNKMGWV